MKTFTFPPGVHLVSLEGDTSPVDFLAAFQYENRHLEQINPSISTMRELDVSQDCCSVILLHHRREDGERFIDRLNQLSTQHAATIFVFTPDPLEFFLEAWQSFTTILTYDKSTNGGTVKKGVGHMPIGPYTLPEPLSDAGTKETAKGPFDNIDEDWQDRVPSDPKKPAETVTKIKDLVKTSRGFHQADITESHADAMLRGQKTDFICSAGRNVQKGDYLVLAVYNKQFHDISEVVWEVTFVSAIAHSERSDGYGAVVLSLRRLPNTRFKKGYIGGEYLDDCIVTTNP